MTNLINKITLGALTLTLTGSFCATAQNSEKRDSIYNSNGKLEKVAIINESGDTSHYYNYNYDKKEQLERTTHKRNDNDNDTTDYKYDNTGKLIQWIRKSKAGTEKTSYKYDEKGRKIEEIFDLNWEHQKLKEKKIYEYDEQGKEIKSYFNIKHLNGEAFEIKYQSKEDYIYDSEGKLFKKVIQTDKDGDGIYEEEHECTCGIIKEAI